MTASLLVASSWSWQPVGRAPRRQGSAGPRAVPIRSAAAMSQGRVPVGVLLSGDSGWPGGREGPRDGGSSSRADGPLTLDPDERGPSALHRRSGAVREPAPPLAQEAGGRRDRIPVHAASCPRRRTGGHERDVGALRGRLSAARGPHDACGRPDRPHRHPDHDADDHEFLQGVRPATTSLIWGDLTLPQTQVERSPTVVLVHGSGGVTPREDRWADELRRAGAATFVLDSFTGRGIAFTAEDQSQLSSLAMIGDAYRALELLATHPRIDSARIAVMGFSKGGFVALYSAVKRFQRLHGPAGAQFATAHRLLSPLPHQVHRRRGGDRSPDPALPRNGRRPRAHRAMPRLRRAAAVKPAPTRRSPSTPAPPTSSIARAPPRRRPREQNASHCFWEERPEGQLVSRDSGQPFSLADPCVVLGGSFGFDPAAYRQALQAVKALAGAGSPAEPVSEAPITQS